MKDVGDTVDLELESDIDSVIIEEGNLVDTEEEDTYVKLQAFISKVKFAVDVAQD